MNNFDDEFLALIINSFINRKTAKIYNSITILNDSYNTDKLHQINIEKTQKN